MIQEVWKPVVGYEGYYQVSNLGNVRSIDRTINGGRWGTEKRIGMPIKLRYTDDHHINVKLHKDGKRSTHHVAALMLEAFVSKRPDGMLACHNDGNGHHNELSNIRWDTPKGNSADTIKHGRQIKGEIHPSSKLKEEEVGMIKKLISNGISVSIIAKIFKVSRATINKIKFGVTWTHIKESEDLPPEFSRILVDDFWNLV
ncbi:MAG: NUMOD4 motif protein [Parcubacteria group bacterium ADurb.Bin216]|nr:MAG: NUMOD4 motif protein [Parcubacteria group bacterium ADurb.Bin216]